MDEKMLAQVIKAMVQISKEQRAIGNVTCAYAIAGLADELENITPASPPASPPHVKSWEEIKQ